MDLPQTPNIILPCDPGTLLLGVYMKKTKLSKPAIPGPPCIKALCVHVSYEINSDAHG